MGDPYCAFVCDPNGEVQDALTSESSIFMIDGKQVNRVITTTNDPQGRGIMSSWQYFLTLVDGTTEEIACSWMGSWEHPGMTEEEKEQENAKDLARVCETARNLIKDYGPQMFVYKLTMVSV